MTRTTLAIGAIAVAALLVVAVGHFDRLSGVSVSGSPILARDVSDMVRMSELIVVGNVRAEGGVRNTARNPKDITRPDPNLEVQSQDYIVAVESVLKGQAADQITVTSARSGTVRHNGRTASYKYENFVPLRPGARYALMLRSVPGDTGVYALAFEPSRFELGTIAVVRSNWTDATSRFPDTPTTAFLETLRAAITANTTTSYP